MGAGGGGGEGGGHERGVRGASITEVSIRLRGDIKVRDLPTVTNF